MRRIRSSSGDAQATAADAFGLDVHQQFVEVFLEHVAGGVAEAVLRHASRRAFAGGRLAFVEVRVGLSGLFRFVCGEAECFALSALLFEEERVFGLADEASDVVCVGFEGQLDVVYFVGVVEGEEGGVGEVEVLDEVGLLGVAEDEDVW